MTTKYYGPHFLRSICYPQRDFHLVAKLMLFHERQQICSLSTVFITATLFSPTTV